MHFQKYGVAPAAVDHLRLLLLSSSEPMLWDIQTHGQDIDSYYRPNASNYFLAHNYVFHHREYL